MLTTAYHTTTTNELVWRLKNEAVETEIFKYDSNGVQIGGIDDHGNKQLNVFGATTLSGTLSVNGLVTFNNFVTAPTFRKDSNGNFVGGGGSLGWRDGQNSQYATALGSGTASSPWSTAMGQATEASAGASTAMGMETKAQGTGSTATGIHTQATGHGSTSMGYQTKASSYCEVAIGQFTTLAPGDPSVWNDSDRVFVIGNGSGDNARSDALVVKKNGNLEVNGDVTCQNLRQTSDARVKDWEAMEAADCLSGIMALEPLVYSFKKSFVDVMGGSSTSKQMGLLAQPLEKVFPHAVSTSSEPVKISEDETVADFKSVNYASLVAPLIGAVKAQVALMEQMEERVKFLERQIETMTR
jgi:hypothetical protein